MAVEIMIALDLSLFFRVRILTNNWFDFTRFVDNYCNAYIITAATALLSLLGKLTLSRSSTSHPNLRREGRQCVHRPSLSCQYR